MLARCVSNDVADLRRIIGPEDRPTPNAGTSKLPLIVDETYLVIAFAFGPIVPWLFLADRFGLRYPLVYPCPMFCISDTRLSRSWAQGAWTDSNGGVNAWLAPPLLINDPMLPSNALEGSRAALISFEEMVDSMSLEFALPWIDDYAVSLERGRWVADMDFIESWEADPSLEMTRRPSSGELLHNPIRDPRIELR